jgi:hypothetical protein
MKPDRAASSNKFEMLSRKEIRRTFSVTLNAVRLNPAFVGTRCNVCCELINIDGDFAVRLPPSMRQGNHANGMTVLAVVFQAIALRRGEFDGCVVMVLLTPMIRPGRGNAAAHAEDYYSISGGDDYVSLAMSVNCKWGIPWKWIEWYCYSEFR